MPQGPRTFGQPVIPDPSAPRWLRPRASPTGRGWGGPGGGERPPRIMVVMPTASSYVPFHITQALVNVAGRFCL